MTTNLVSSASLSSITDRIDVSTFTGTALKIDRHGNFTLGDGTVLDFGDDKNDIELLREKLAEFMILNRITKEDIKSIMREVLDERFGCQCGTILS